jgi:hypothetical protein
VSALIVCISLHDSSHVSTAPHDVTPANSGQIIDAMRKASLPSVLVSSKCDTPSANRELDPDKIERGARNTIAGLVTLQTSETDVENHRKAMAIVLKQIVLGGQGKAVDLRRTQKRS